MEEKAHGEPEPYDGLARRVHIADIVTNENRDLNGSGRVQFAEVRIFGTVVSKRIFRSEGKVDYGFLSVDDGSGFVIQVKAWGSDTPAVEKVEQGDMVDVLGRVRHKEEEVYIIPEIIRRIDDPNWETVRELEIIRDHLRQNKIKLSGSGLLGFHRSDLESEILETIEHAQSNIGIEYYELIKSIEHSSEEEIKKALKELLNQGIICEPRPGRYRK